MATATIARPSSIHSQRRSPLSTSTTYPSKNTMSITQTYYLAHKARGKLSREAAQPDHDLRLLVGHANLLDSLMLELAEAEREQERFFNQAVRGNKASPKKSTVEQQRHIQWADRIEEEAFEDDSSSDSDSDSDFDEEDLSVPAPRATLSRQDADIEVDDDEEEDFAQLELVRTTSHSNSPPDLIDHDSDSSEDEHMPPSPTDAALPLPDKQAKAEQQEMFHDDFYSSRQHNHSLSRFLDSH
ncbi:hypothetical protein Golomagni_05449 [Golovinomyces magnicellulatus]|nr:hypothetical protein Golomagni_05449 [Golovinomyces magnicellulatus]